MQERREKVCKSHIIGRRAVKIVPSWMHYLQSQKIVLATIKLGLQIVVSHHVGTRNLTLVSCKSSKCSQLPSHLSRHHPTSHPLNAIFRLKHSHCNHAFTEAAAANKYKLVKNQSLRALPMPGKLLVLDLGRSYCLHSQTLNDSTMIYQITLTYSLID